MYNNKKIILLAFASTDLIRSAKRLKKEAKNSKFYDEIKICNNNDFDKDIKIFINNLIKHDKKRGYCYWIWKPYFIYETFKKLNYGDIIHYTDIGCHIIGENYKRFYEYLDMFSDANRWLLPFQYKKDNKTLSEEYEYPNREEYKFTKSDLLNYFGCLNDPTVVNTPQYWAGNFFIRKSHDSIRFIKEWLDIFYKRFDLVDDTPSILNNHLKFVENRHDQSVFSILCKKKNISSLSAYELDWAILHNKRTWEHNKYSPILAKRDLEYSIYKRFINRQKKTYRRLKNKYFEKFKTKN